MLINLFRRHRELVINVVLFVAFFAAPTRLGAVDGDAVKGVGFVAVVNSKTFVGSSTPYWILEISNVVNSAPGRYVENTGLVAAFSVYMKFDEADRLWLYSGDTAQLFLYEGRRWVGRDGNEQVYWLRTEWDAVRQAARNIYFPKGLVPQNGRVADGLVESPGKHVPPISGKIEQ